MNASRSYSAVAIEPEPRSEADREETERGLLERIAARDPRAMYEFYLLYYPRVRRLIGRITRQPELIEEIVNDTFVVIWRQASAFRGESRISTGVFGIAYRRRLISLRAELRVQNSRQSAAQAADDINSGFTETTAETATADWLAKALARLSVTHRTVVELTYGLGLSCEETATVMQCPVNTVKTRMLYARRRLRHVLQELELPASALERETPRVVRCYGALGGASDG
jgi:RNA polymerase sigma-70 factor (ECF subfamily)